MNAKSPSASARDLVLVTAADDGYAMPLAVTIRSALDRLDSSRNLRLIILDGGLTDDSKIRLLQSWRDPRLSVQWIRPDVDLVRDLPVSHHVTVTSYLRLLTAELLPTDVARAIYLDADTLVQRDLGALWDEPQGDKAVLAVQDFAAPYIDAAASMPDFERRRQHLAAFTPIANYRELGLPADGRYFNGGMLVIDLDQWRQHRYAGQMLDCLRRHRQHVLWWDQYALNVVLAGNWRALDRRWNQGAHIYNFPNWQESPFDRDEFDRLRKSPWIVHFCSPAKPWHYFCRHPYAREFCRCLDRTAWHGWRPARPDRFAKAWWDFYYTPLRLRIKTGARLAKQQLRRRAA